MVSRKERGVDRALRMVVTPALGTWQADGSGEGHSTAFSDLGDILVFRSGGGFTAFVLLLCFMWIVLYLIKRYRI